MVTEQQYVNALSYKPGQTEAYLLGGITAIISFKCRENPKNSMMQRIYNPTEYGDSIHCV